MKPTITITTLLFALSFIKTSQFCLSYINERRVLSSYSNSFSSWRPLFQVASNKLQRTPEFSRILNVAKVPAKRPVLCKILAKESELELLAKRLDTFSVEYFAANVTLRRESNCGILITGDYEAIVKDGELLESERIASDFDTLLLDTTVPNAASFEEATEYDDEIGPNGDIDIGEIVLQYLSMELF